jgi:glycerol-3-phosphate dehydrogenase
MFVEPEPIVSEILWNRAQLISALNKNPVCDVLIIGGGIHGAAMARIAALNGLRTVLLEMQDYASGTSSRSSKLAHGGLRYLAMGDLRQVYESVRAREELYTIAPHLVYPWPFFIPLPFGAPLKKLQISLALRFYEGGRVPRHLRRSWISAQDRRFQDVFGSESHHGGAYQYFDGIMRDGRLVIETILSARQEGARCLNYARVDSVQHRNDGSVEVGWTDVRTDLKHTITAGVVVNCAGPWAPQVGRVQSLANKLRYSRGSHLLFSVPWNHPALFLPLEGKNRYYFVLPHPGGTLVGTTEREVSAPLDLDPLPTRDEIDEILVRLKKDLPHKELTRERLFYAFAGIRALPLRNIDKDVSKLSRRHLWELRGGMLTLYGGKYTSAYWTAWEGFKLISKYLSSAHAIAIHPVRNRLLPGAVRYREVLEDTLKSSDDIEIHRLIRQVHGLFGGRLATIADYPEAIQPLGGVTLKGAVRYAFEYEQVVTLEDLVRRRLDLEYLPGFGEEQQRQVAEYYQQISGSTTVQEEMSDLTERCSVLRDLMGQSKVDSGGTSGYPLC